MPAYQVTGKAGHWVAGRRVSVGDVLQLTARQAEHELRLGTIAPVGAPQGGAQAAKAAPAIAAKAKAPTPPQAATGTKGGAS
jgi:hypothetical protein